MRCAVLLACLVSSACHRDAPTSTSSASVLQSDAAPMPSPSVAPSTPPPKATARRLSDGRIHIDPSGVELDPGLHWFVAGADLETIRVCTGEWDREFAEVLDATLPFESMLSHSGSEPMCKGAGYFDHHVVTYMVAQPREQVVAAIRKQGAAKVATLQSGRLGDEEVSAKWAPRFDYPGYDHVGFAYPRFYGDYGGTARVDYLARSIGAQTLVLVFLWTKSPVMFADNVRIDPIEKVMLSVQVP